MGARWRRRAPTFVSRRMLQQHRAFLLDDPDEIAGERLLTQPVFWLSLFGTAAIQCGLPIFLVLYTSSTGVIISCYLYPLLVIGTFLVSSILRYYNRNRPITLGLLFSIPLSLAGIGAFVLSLFPNGCC